MVEKGENDLYAFLYDMLFDYFVRFEQIYLQIMKQLTNNPKPDSTAKGWQVMCMSCSTFLPSMDFENFLLNFILEKCQIEGAEVCLNVYY